MNNNEIQKIIKDVKSASKMESWHVLTEEIFDKINEKQCTFKELEEGLKKHGLTTNNVIINFNKAFCYCYVVVENVYVELMFLDYKLFDFLKLKDRINKMQEHQQECLKNKDYINYFCMIADDFKIYEFEKHYKDIKKEDVWEVFKYIYCKLDFSINVWNKDILYEVLNNRKNERTKEDKKVTIYRGEGSLSKSYKDCAISWTTDINVAKRFISKDTRDNNCVIYKAVVEDKNIIDYIDDRNEDEILIFGKDIKNVEIVE